MSSNYQETLDEMRRMRENFVDYDLSKIPAEPGERYGFIYAIQNLRNGKMYIGSTKDYYERAATYIRKYRNPQNLTTTRLIHKAMLEEGIENFRMFPLYQCNSENSLRDLESLYMTDFNTLYPNGYNTTTMTSSLTHTAKIRRMKSRPMIAVNPKDKTMYVAESSSLIAKHVFDNADRSIMVRDAKLGISFRDYYFYYLDPKTCKENIDRKLEQCATGKIREKDIRNTEKAKLYIGIGQGLLSEGLDFFRRNEFKMYKIYYNDLDSVYSIDEIK